MIAFILGLIAGFAAPLFEATIKKGLDAALMAETPLGEAELRCLSLAVCLLVAAVVAAILSTAAAIPLTLGAVVGLFVPRIIARFR